MQISAKARYIRVSPRKTRLVAANIKNQAVGKALDLLRFTPQKPARALYKVLYSAVANAEQTALDVDNLYVKQILVDRGPYLKRIKPRAMGRATRILKKTSHITIIIDEQ